MPLSTNARNRIAASIGGAVVGLPVTHLSLHSAFPGDTGAFEISGGSPAYARKSVTWNAVSNGILSQQGSVTFDVPAGTVGFIGMWTASTAGTWMGGVPANGGTVYGFGVGRAGSSILSPAHGLANGDTVYLEPSPSLPAGYTAETAYVVSVVDADQFHLTLSGVTVSPTTSAALLWQRYVADTYASQGTMSVSGLAVNMGK